MGGTMRWAELRMCRFWAGGISSFPFSRAREYRLLRRLVTRLILKTNNFAAWKRRKLEMPVPECHYFYLFMLINVTIWTEFVLNVTCSCLEFLYNHCPSLCRPVVIISFKTHCLQNRLLMCQFIHKYQNSQVENITFSSSKYGNVTLTNTKKLVKGTEPNPSD
jgi:hypothetical protein